MPAYSRTFLPNNIVLKPDTLKIKEDTLSDEMLESQVKYSARDSITYVAEGQKIFLFGEATVDYSGTNLKAAYIEIDSKNNLIIAQGALDSTGKMSGYPEFKDAENQMRCEKIIYNTKTKKGKIYGVLTNQANMLVYGEAIKKDTNNVMYIKNAKCIPCEFEDAVFYFRATKAKVIPDDKIVTGPIFVEIAGIKTPLGLPFGFFPNVKNKSKSGVLMPYLGQSPGQGYFLQNGGFYFPINNKMDMQLTGDIYTIGSWALRTSSNYYTRYKHRGNFRLEYKEIHTGEKEITYSPTSPNGFQRLKNFSVQWSHQQDSKSRPNDRFSANVNVQSGLNNKYNSQSTAQYLTNTFFSVINYSHSFKNSTLSVNARHNQNTLTRYVEINLPELTYNVNRFFPFKNETRAKQNWVDKLGVNYLLESKSFIRQKDTSFLKGNIADTIQYGARHSLPISTNFNLLKYFTLTPSLNLSSVMYYKTTEYNYNKDSNKVYMKSNPGFKAGFDGSFSTSLTTKVFGDYYFNSKRIKQIRHFIIPTVGFTYHPDLTKQYYKTVALDSIGQKQIDSNKVDLKSGHTKQYSVFENRMYGGPVGAESGVLNMNLNNNLEAKVRQKTDSGYTYKKIVLLQNLSIGANYNLAATKFKWSMISITARNRVWKNIDLLATSNFDPYSLDSVGNRQDILEYKTSQYIARFVGGTLALNANFNPQVFSKANSSSSTANWNINTGYNLNYEPPHFGTKEKITQTFNFNGNIEVTKNWKLGFNSGYDFKNNNLSYTSFNLYRDLRCWEAHIDWVPFGFNKRYSVSINLKSPALRDIKIPRTRAWYDNL